jgi:prephenate dehydrogenase
MASSMQVWHVYVGCSDVYSMACVCRCYLHDMMLVLLSTLPHFVTSAIGPLVYDVQAQSKQLLLLLLMTDQKWVVGRAHVVL